MAIASGNTTTVASATASDWVKLKSGVNRIYVRCDTWSTTSVTMQSSNDAVYVYPVEDGNGSVIATANKVFDVDGPGYVRMNATAYAASPVTLLASNPIDDRF